MRKVILMMLLAVVSNSVMAEWVKLGVTSDHSATIYVNPATIHKKGNKAKMWALTDYNEAPKIDGLPPYLSLKSQEEYDCKDEQARTISASLHSGNMGHGDVTNAFNPKLPEWVAVPPDSLVEARWKFACKKR